MEDADSGAFFEGAGLEEGCGDGVGEAAREMIEAGLGVGCAATNAEVEAVEAFEGDNLVIVDEGHRGVAGEDWKGKRDRLCAQGFSYEYSATFGQAVRAATGTPWNGFSFFGLGSKPGRKNGSN